jgi:hypothetical protein
MKRTFVVVVLSAAGLGAAFAIGYLARGGAAAEVRPASVGPRARATPAAAPADRAARRAPPRLFAAAPTAAPAAEPWVGGRAAARARMQPAPAAPSLPGQAAAPAPERQEAPPPSPAVLARERGLRQTLERLSAGHPGVTVQFADCEASDCVARVSAREPAALDGFVADARKSRLDFPTIQVHERLTAYNGRLFQADLTVPAERVPPSPESSN